MPEKRETILIVEPDAGARKTLLDLLRGADYDVATAETSADGFEAVRNVGVDLMLLRADLSDLECCEALSEVKGSAATSITRVILLTEGAGAARARGLDLGADDVITLPWDAAELLSRVRVQMREKRALAELQEKTRIADEGREVAQTAFQALAVTEKMTRDAFSLERALKMGVSALFALAIVISIIFVLFSRRAEKETRRAYSVIAKLERGVHAQEALIADARKAREERDDRPAAADRK